MVGVIIVTHGQVGLEMLRTAQEIVGRIERAEAVTIEAAEKIERARTKIEAAIKRVSMGAGYAMSALRLDYAYVPYRLDLGESHRVSLTARF